MYALTFSSQVHNLQKLKKNLLKHLYFATNEKVTCLSENIFFIFKFRRYIEDIYFFEVNNKYISSSVLKTSEFS